MDITESDVQAFIEIYKSEYGITLSAEQAMREAEKLFHLYKLVYLDPAEPFDTKSEIT